MPSFGKKSISEDEDSDDMGSTKQILNKKSSVKKRKRNNTKQEENEEENTDSVSIVVPITSPNIEPEKKKMKKEKKPKQKATPKKKAPLDLDRQCGVLIAPNNNPCTRSLTCKIHAMGAKRAVEGRSQPFNELLAAYQKKGIGRPQVPGSNDKGVDSKLKNQNQTKKTTISNSSNNNNNSTSIQTSSVLLNKEEENDIDSDEETENVRMAIEQNKPIPLGTKKIFYVRRKRKYYKLRDILFEAITPKDTTATTTSATTANLSSSGTELSLDQLGF